ncbi:MAG: DNA polymerase III subunit delta [Marinilabiliales bacterium]|nr:MAG: DNA polymerase III subunit delta [Marinilabiliales bacterium]
MKTALDIIKDIQKKIYFPVYFLAGDEPYYINKISDYIEDNVLEEDEKEFNSTILYGRDVEMSALISKLKSFPMMSNYQLVILKNAQDIPEKDYEPLISYFENPLNSTILVVSYHKKPGKRIKAKLDKIKTGLEYFESVRLRDDKVAAWITQHLQKKGFTCSPKISQILADYLGNDLEKIENELLKLTINVEKGSAINMDDVEANIGISKNFNIFELQSAIATRNQVKAIQISHYFAANTKENSIFKMIPVIYSFFSKVMIYHQLKDKKNRGDVARALKINPYFAGDYETAALKYNATHVLNVIKLLREYDMKAKGVNNQFPEGELIKELIYKIVVLS